MMYIILGTVLIGLGLFMVLCPKQATKKENRENPEAVNKVKKSGIAEIVCGALLVVLGLVVM